jgi:hypothetical protein
MPPKVTIDPRNDSKTQIEEYKIGSCNMTGILQEKGKTHASHIRERCNEIVERKQIKAEVEALNPGVTIDDRELQMLTPNEVKEPVKLNSSGEPDDTIRFENLKSQFDAFGVGVRSGGITPSREDEQQFRELGGLPTMPPAVEGAWDEDEGFRRPITLLSGSSAPPVAQQTNEDE